MAFSNLSFVRHTGDGSRTQFAITVAGDNMGYLRTEDIHTYVDDVEVPNVINPQSPHIVSITPAPAKGADVLIRREMPVSKTYADFSRGNNFGHRQVNNSFLQQLYLTQELIDGFTPQGFYMKQDINYGGHVLTNLGDAVNPDDAVKKSVTDALDSRMTSTESRMTSVEGRAAVVESRADALDAGLNKTNNRVTSLENSIPVSSLNYITPYRYDAIGGEVSITTGYSFSYCELYINGIAQTVERSFNFMNGTIYFAEPLEAGDEVFVRLGSLGKAELSTVFSNARIVAVGGETETDSPDYQFTALFINGIYQAPNASYAKVGDKVMFAEPLEEGDEVDFWYV